MLNKRIGIFKYLSIQVFSSFFIKIINSLFIIILATKISIEDFGIYNLIWSIISFICYFSDLGITTYSINKYNQKDSKSLSKIISAKLSLSIIIYISFIIIINTIDMSDLQKKLLYILGALIVPNTIKYINNIVGSVYNKLDYYSWIYIIQNIIMFCINIIILNNFYNLKIIFLNFVIIELLFALYSFRYINNNLFKFKFSINIFEIIYYINKSREYALLTILGYLYLKIDYLILSIMTNYKVIGYYASIYKIFEIWMIIPTIFTLTFLPIYNNLYIKNILDIKIIRKHALYMCFLGMLIVLLINLFTGQLIIFLFGHKYLSTEIALKVLSCAIPISFINIVFYNYFYSSNQQKTVIFIFLSSLSLNIILNIILIAKYSYLGCAITTVLSELFNCLLSMYLYRRKLSYVSSKCIKLWKKIYI